jgi:hypothetical protein
MDQPKQPAPYNYAAAGEAAAEIDRLLTQYGQTLSETVTAELWRVRAMVAGPAPDEVEPSLAPDPRWARAPGLDERRYPRISYVESARPRLMLGTVEYEVTDCSEQGLRLRLRGEPVPAPGLAVKGCVTFRSGSVVTVTGKVLRIEDRYFVLYLEDRLIPASVIDAEERYLRMNYPPETYGAAAGYTPIPAAV